MLEHRAPEIEKSQLARYRTLINQPGMDDRQKDQIISIVHGIMRDFVDRAFGVTARPIILCEHFARTGAAVAECATLPAPPPESIESKQQTELSEKNDEREQTGRHLLPS